MPSPSKTLSVVVSVASSLSSLSSTTHGHRSTSTTAVTTASHTVAACAVVSSLSSVARVASPSATPTVDAKLAHDCLNSVPLNTTAALQYVNGLEPYIEWQSDLEYLKDPPAEYFYPPLDVMGKLASVKSNLQTGGLELRARFPPVYSHGRDLTEYGISGLGASGTGGVVYGRAGSHGQWYFFQFEALHIDIWAGVGDFEEGIASMIGWKWTATAFKLSRLAITRTLAGQELPRPFGISLCKKTNLPKMLPLKVRLAILNKDYQLISYVLTVLNLSRLILGTGSVESYDSITAPSTSKLPLTGATVSFVLRRHASHYRLLKLQLVLNRLPKDQQLPRELRLLWTL
uniref:RNA-dependent RNA polymerase n=1 Tax=Sclerotinia sclerotiorum mitovirus 9-U TaxID=2879895 RepID=A0A8K1MYS3_9VIRU|nr:RNA-dependent RNA polymerase [Sclerotinia sclerotiorum mitovirus 9-U]